MKILFFLLLITLSFGSQLKAQLNVGFQNLKQINAIAQKKLTPERYVDSVNRMLFGLVAKGLYYDKDTLIYYLKTYQETIWNNPELKSERANYYINLGNNSSGQNRIGEAIFFMKRQIRNLKKYRDENLHSH